MDLAMVTLLLTPFFRLKNGEAPKNRRAFGALRCDAAADFVERNAGARP